MAPSPNTERGLYFGRPEPVSELRVRTDDREATEPLLSLPEGLALSDGEDWYDKEEWGLTEDLKKGQDEEEEDTTQTQKKTRNRK